jgi:hypothetical protein
LPPSRVNGEPLGYHGSRSGTSSETNPGQVFVTVGTRQLRRRAQHADHSKRLTGGRGASDRAPSRRVAGRPTPTAPPLPRRSTRQAPPTKARRSREPSGRAWLGQPATIAPAPDRALAGARPKRRSPRPAIGAQRRARALSERRRFTTGRQVALDACARRALRLGVIAAWAPWRPRSRLAATVPPSLTGPPQLAPVRCLPGCRVGDRRRLLAGELEGGIDRHP